MKLHPSASGRRPRLPSILVTSIAAVGGGAIVHFIYHMLAAQVIEGQSVGWVFIIFSLAVITYMLLLIFEKLEDIYERQRIEVRFFSFTTPEAAREAYTEAARVIADAREDGQTEIYALNSVVDKFEEAAPVAEEVRRSYFEAIERKIGKVSYHRILQVRDFDAGGTRPIAEMVSGNYLQHYITVLNRRTEATERRTILQVAPARFPISFVIVENHGGPSHLIWQLDEHKTGAAARSYRVAGLLFITDPDHRIIRHFRMLFNQVAADGARTVRPQDLAPQPGLQPPLPSLPEATQRTD